MKKMHTHTLLHEGMRFVVLFFIVLFACNGFAQEQYARPITIDTNSLDVNSKCKRIMVYTFDNNPETRWIVGTNNRPEGKVTDTSYYLLFHDAFLPTMAKNSGNMVYDGDTIPLNEVVFDGIKVSNHYYRRLLEEIPKLNARLELHRTVFRFNEDSISDRYSEESNLYKVYRDSIIKTQDQLFLCFDNLGDKGLHFALIINDSLVKRNDFILSDRILLDSSLTELILKNKHEELTMPGNSSHPIDNRIAVVARGRQYCFIKEFNIDVKEDRSAVPPISESSSHIPWPWLIIGLAVLAVLAVIILILTGKLKFSKIIGEKIQRTFTIPLGKILTNKTDYDKAVENLTKLAEGDSIDVKVDPDDKNICFIINEKNAHLFVDEAQNGFFANLKKYIEDADPSKQRQNIKQEEARKTGEEIEKANETIKEIADFVAQFTQHTDAENWQKLRQAMGENAPNNAEELIQWIKELNDDISKVKNAENWQKLMLAFDKNAPKNAEELIQWIKKLNDEIKAWKDETKYADPNAAQKGIDTLKQSIKDLTADKNKLEVAKGNLDSTLEKVKKEPKSFKDEKGYDELTKLIKDAEKGSEVRDLMNNDPNEVDKNSATGILVRKGQIFDKYVEIDDSVFKDKDSESKIRKAIEKSKIAMQVRKGNFLDKAKDDVKLLNKDEENYLGECKLKEFIAFIVNPDKILETSYYTKTGLFKMVKDLDTFIKAKADKNEPISMDGFASKWLKERLTVLVAGYNDNLNVEHVASHLGTDGYNTEGMKPNVKQVFDNASSYIGFGLYRNYWKNIVSPLFTALNELQNHDVVYNTRILMFYTSQFYSIANIMNEIFGDTSYSTKRPKLNVALFNGANAPVPDNRVGFPKLDDSSLNDCLFEYKGAEGEDAKVRFLKQYKPLPFILIYNYYSDNILS